MLKKVMFAALAILIVFFLVYSVVSGDQSFDDGGRWDEKVGVGDWME